MSEIRLNIGAGDAVIEGFTPVDRKTGLEAYPLGYEDDSVDEIRASHILEHFDWATAPKALADWVRVLKPGGRIRIAVPDFEKCVRVADRDRLWSRYITGGQTDANDFHKSIWCEPDLRVAMTEAGIANIQPWASSDGDAASLPISLNLEGVKGVKADEFVKICAVMSIPRVGWNDNWGQIHEALLPFNMPIRRASGVYWGQCMQAMLEKCVEDGIDWALTIDYDSMFTHQHVSMLMNAMGQDPKIDALASLQAKRQCETPLVSMGHLCKPADKDAVGPVSTMVEIKNEPMLVTTAHFGLTLLRLDALREVPKPWFKSEPCEDGTFGEGHLDEDIWFWHAWRRAGKTIYFDPRVRIGHLEVMVHEFDHELKSRYVNVVEWRDAHGYPDEIDPTEGSSTCTKDRDTCKCKESDSSEPGESPAADDSTPETLPTSSPT